MKIRDVELTDLAHEIHALNRQKGFYDGVDPKDPRQMADKVLLTICELAEMTEELREAEPRMSEKIPGYTAEDEEWADAFIRHLDVGVARGFIEVRLDAVLAKVEYNKTRPYKHSKVF